MTAKQLSYVDLIKNNLGKESISIALPRDVTATRVLPLDVDEFPHVLKLLIACFCRHPRRIFEEIQRKGEQGIEEVVRNLFAETVGISEEGESPKAGVRVWRGTVGEVMATAYVIGFTSYVVPVFKLRYAPNRRVSMHGDDLLGFRFTKTGEPSSLLVGEAKNWQDNIGGAVKAANETLLKVKATSPTLLNFVIDVLDEQGRHEEAKMVQRFLDDYDYNYDKRYLAFIVSDKKKWKDELCHLVSPQPATPLEIATFIMLDSDTFQESLTWADEELPRVELPTVKVDDLGDVQRLLDNALFKNHHSKLASAALASSLEIEGKERIRYEIDPKRIERAVHFVSTTAIRLSFDQKQKSQSLLYYAARTFERLAIWQLERGDKDSALSAIVDGAVAYAIAGYGSNARVLTELISTIQSDPSVFLVPTERFSALFLSGRLSDLEDQVATILLSSPRFDSASAKTEQEWAESVGLALAHVSDILIAKSFALMLHYLRIGRSELVDGAVDCLQRAAMAYSLIGEYKSSHLSRILTVYFRRLAEDSPYTLLPKYVVGEEMDSAWRQYVRGLRLGRFPLVSFWNSQKIALEGGLLGKESLILSMPTSSGKTRTVELAIYDVLKKNPEGVCAYVVPTRALAAEVEQSLSSRLGRMGIKVSLLYGGYDFSPFEEQMLAENRVIVFTPEKLDLIVRQNEDFKKRLSLIVIDEVQQVASPAVRSLRIEFILSRILRLAEKNKARVICLSAVINNPQDFARWISGNPENKSETEWRPTVQRYGLFQWFQDRGRIWYPPLRDEFPTEDFFVPLLFSRQDLDGEDKRKIEVAARISIFYSRTGATLVFTTTKYLVEEIVDTTIRLLRDNPPETSPERERLARACATIVGDGHKLVTAIKLGFCYHHGQLPRSVRRIVENGIREGTLPLIISTTTLTEGVNLPIKNVIVHSLYFGTPVSTTQFWNAAGRAGRAGYETEGHIIFCFYKDLQRIAESQPETSESFVASGIRLLIESRLPSLQDPNDFVEKWALASTPQFREDWSNYESWGEIKRRNAEQRKREILSVLDSQLLAWALEESVTEIDNETIEGWIGRTLFSIQTLDLAEETRKFKAGLKNRAIAVKQLVPDENERRLYNRTGLSILGNKAINKTAKGLHSKLPSLEQTNRLPREFLLELLEGMKTTPEMSQLARVEGELLADWVAGTDYMELANRYYDGDIERTVKDIENAIFTFPWGCHSLVQHFRTLVSDDAIPKLIWNLPSLVYHGVPTLAAVYAMNLGVPDRQFAIKLADEYLKEHESPTYGEFKEWLQCTDYAEWLDMFADQDRDIVDDYYERFDTKRNASEQPKVVLDFDLVDMMEIAESTDEDLIIVKYRGDFWLCTFDFRKLGKLAGANISRLEQVDRQNRDLILEDFSRDKKRVGVRIL